MSDPVCHARSVQNRADRWSIVYIICGQLGAAKLAVAHELCAEPVGHSLLLFVTMSARLRPI
jgi:hypothetical protein